MLRHDLLAMISFMIVNGITIQCWGSDGIPWDLDQLHITPSVYPASDWKADGVRSMFYEGLPYKGKPTKIFAWYGLPEVKEGQKVPAVVCLHGGGGTAMDQWVRIWNQRGYAAIAMDLVGTLPRNDYPDRPRHQYSGPSRKDVFRDIDEPIQDQWMYHAVADAILAHSLLRSFPEVDSEKIGLTGISWGAVVSNVVMGVDNRFKFAVPVYGCSFLFDATNYFGDRYKEMGEDGADKCKKLWDGASYLDKSKMPSLWINGTNDKHFYLDFHQKSYRKTMGPRNLSIRPGMKHSHQDGWRPKEIYVFADSIVKGTTPLARVVDQGRKGMHAWCAFDSKTKIIDAELVYCENISNWDEADWKTRKATIDYLNNEIFIDLPEKSQAYFFNLTDERELVVSSEYLKVDE